MTTVGGPTLGYNASLTTNFALFAREITGLARDGDPWRGEPAWPPAYVQGEIEEPLRGQARTEWVEWWAELVRGARTLHHSGDAMKVSDVMDPPDFRRLSNRQALQRVCQVAWPHFLGWWGPGSGSAFVFRAKTYLREWWETMPKKGNLHLTLDFQYVSGKTCEVVADDYVMFGSGWLGNPSDMKMWLSQNVRE